MKKLTGITYNSKKYADLSEDEREIFFKAFYDSTGVYEVNDMDSPNPWGAPWEWTKESYLLSEDIAEAAKLFWKRHSAEIIELIEESNRGENHDSH